MTIRDAAKIQPCPTFLSMCFSVHIWMWLGSLKDTLLTVNDL